MDSLVDYTNYLPTELPTNLIQGPEFLNELIKLQQIKGVCYKNCNKTVI